MLDFILKNTGEAERHGCGLWRYRLFGFRTFWNVFPIACSWHDAQYDDHAAGRLKFDQETVSAEFWELLKAEAQIDPTFSIGKYNFDSYYLKLAIAWTFHAIATQYDKVNL